MAVSSSSAPLDEMLSTQRLTRYCNLTTSIPTSKTVTLDDRFANDPAFSKEKIEQAIQLTSVDSRS